METKMIMIMIYWNGCLMLIIRAYKVFWGKKQVVNQETVTFNDTERAYTFANEIKFWPRYFGCGSNFGVWICSRGSLAICCSDSCTWECCRALRFVVLPSILFWPNSLQTAWPILTFLSSLLKAKMISHSAQYVARASLTCLVLEIAANVASQQQTFLVLDEGGAIGPSQ